MTNDITKISNKIKNNGFISINNFLEKKNLNLAEEALNQKSIKGKDSNYPVFTKQYLIKLLKMDFKILKNSFILKNIAKNLKLKDIAEKVFDCEAELHMIDSYYSEKSNENIITWHNDIGLRKDSLVENFYNESKATLTNQKNKVSARGIKFFIYMTDVQSDNGALAVIPFSNRIVRTLTNFILEKKIELKPYWNLKSLRDLIVEEKNKSLITSKLGSDLVNTFLNNTNFINEKNKDSHSFDLEMKKGSAVIFDELCVHRGSAPKKNSRTVLRFLYRKK